MLQSTSKAVTHSINRIVRYQEPTNQIIPSRKDSPLGSARPSSSRTISRRTEPLTQPGQNWAGLDGIGGSLGSARSVGFDRLVRALAIGACRRGFRGSPYHQLVRRAIFVKLCVRSGPAERECVSLETKLARKRVGESWNSGLRRRGGGVINLEADEEGMGVRCDFKHSVDKRQ